MGIMSIRRMAHKLLAPVVLILVVALLIGVFYIGVPNWGKETYGYKGPSVKVYGKTVKDADFDNYMMRAAQQADQFAQFKAYSEAEIRDAALGTAIQVVAFEHEMKQAKIKVSNAEIEKATKKYFPTPEELNSFMEQQGLSKSDFRKILTKELEYQKFIQNKARELKIEISEEDVLEYLEEITVSHILVSVNSDVEGGRSNTEALARANEVFQKLTSNGDFAKLAKEYSDDPGSKDNAGLIGPMPLAQFKRGMVKEFVDGSLALEPGEISKPVKSQYGYHVIRLDSIEKPSEEEYKNKYREIEDQLLFEKAEYDPKYRKWLEETFKKAEDNMEILDPGLRAYRLMKDEKWQEASEAYQKALKKKFYKNKADIYVDAATVYLKLEQPSKAIEMLSNVPGDVQVDLEVQTALAKAYYENKQPEKAKEQLLEYGEGNLDNATIHQRLKDIFSDWEMKDAVEKEERILADIQKKEEEALRKYQQELEQRNQK